MKIRKSTLYRDIAHLEPLMTDDDKKKLEAVAEKELKDMWSLTVEDFFKCIHGDFAVVGITKETKDNKLTALQVYWCKRFAHFVEELIELFEKMTVPMDLKTKQASEGLLTFQFEESVYIFAQKHFGLHSYQEADKLLMYELLLAKKVSYNEQMLQRRIAEADIAAMKRRSRH